MIVLTVGNWNPLMLKILSALHFLMDQVKTDVCNELKTDNLI